MGEWRVVERESDGLKREKQDLGIEKEEREERVEREVAEAAMVVKKRRR